MGFKPTSNYHDIPIFRRDDDLWDLEASQNRFIHRSTLGRPFSVTWPVSFLTCDGRRLWVQRICVSLIAFIFYRSSSSCSCWHLFDTGIWMTPRMADISTMGKMKMENGWEMKYEMTVSLDGLWRVESGERREYR